MKTEIWKIIDGYPNYMVSNLGRVKSLGNNKMRKEKILKCWVKKDGYVQIRLNKYGKGKKYYVHRLVAEAFIPNPNNLPEVNHKSEIKTQNNVENLEWCDRKYNMNYGTLIERAAEKIKGRTDIVEKRVAKLLKPIQQIDLETGIVLKKWPSIVEVQRKLGYNQSCINNCLRGRTKASYGYKWEYGA